MKLVHWLYLSALLLVLLPLGQTLYLAQQHAATLRQHDLAAIEPRQ